MSQGKIVEEIGYQQVLHSFCNGYALGTHAQWVCHAWNGLEEVMLHGRHGEDVAQGKLRMLG